ncbi:hypothetical protein [Candidatus Stoquefichus sp. SB1]|uniref:hypothetical protein n=1 Tax=Candidatus Stoquefichus sp. SB1 TaxID=1658109 RepID=UPI00067E739C|nr:hypothetical protein [Candidatus Stoquefichus sp. SB1]
MERSYEMFKTDVTLIRELLEEREKEFFRAMEINETEENGKRKGIVNLLSRMIMKKYHKDVADYLKQCNEDELERISDLMNENASYESLIKQCMKK